MSVVHLEILIPARFGGIFVYWLSHALVADVLSTTVRLELLGESVLVSWCFVQKLWMCLMMAGANSLTVTVATL